MEGVDPDGMTLTVDLEYLADGGEDEEDEEDEEDGEDREAGEGEEVGLGISIIIIIIVVVVVVVVGLSLLQSTPPTTANKQTRAQKKVYIYIL